MSDPANALGALAGKAHLKYVETKAVIGGVPHPRLGQDGHPYEGWLVRNVEYETFRARQEVRLPVGAPAQVATRITSRTVTA